MMRPREKLEHPYVLADVVRIREVLVNILSNAVKFTDDGGTVPFSPCPALRIWMEENSRVALHAYSPKDEWNAPTPRPPPVGVPLGIPSQLQK